MRGLCVAALAFFVISNLMLIGFSWTYEVRSFKKLAFLGILALVALALLARAWKSFVSSR